MDSLPAETSCCTVCVASSTPDTASWLSALLAAYEVPAGPPPQACKIEARLKHIPFEAVVKAVEGARPSLAAHAEIRLYDDWIAENGGTSRHIFAAWFNLGVALTREGDYDRAAIAYSNARELKPDFYPAVVNLGLTLETMGQTDAALRTWESAIQNDEIRTTLLNHRGRLMEGLGRLDEAEAALRASLLTNFSQPDAAQHWLHIRQKACRWPVLAADIPGIPTAELLRLSGPFSILALTDDISVQREVAALWLARKMPPVPTCLSPLEGYHHDRIKVGYLSSDFCRHAMSFLIAELFERHNRGSFEIFGYCASRDDGSDIRRRVINAFDHYRAIRDLSDEQAATAIRKDEIDILIDLNGLTAGTRLGVLRWKPAPIQATYLGYVGPVPLPELDYLLCDGFVIPTDFADRYSPTPLPIPHLYQANDTKRGIGRKMSRTEAGLPEECFVFCCFSRHYKITEEMFGAWTEILRATGNSVLWLARDNTWSEANLQDAAERAGIPCQRLIFADRIDPDLYMSRMRLADLFLDTFPYNAGTVASDAMRMELPLLTLCGEAFASRMAGSLLTSLGQPEGIAKSYAEYIAKAIRLATDANEYWTFRTAFTHAAWVCSIGNIGRFTEDFEAILRDTYQRLMPQMSEPRMGTIVLHQPVQPEPRNERCLDDLTGENYQLILERLHGALHPQTYFGIGVETGKTLALARCPSIAVDPQFSFVDLPCVQQIMAKPSLMLFQTTSDDFFVRFKPDVLFGRPVEFAFLDGMHHCEYLLRDFINTEQCCRKSAVIVLHDCLPVELPMTSRNPGHQSIDPRRQRMWTGDVWRTALLLKRRRPDLSIVTLDAAPTGLVLITHLDPTSRLLRGCYDECVSEMLNWSLEDMGLAAYHDEMAIQSTHIFDLREDIVTRFLPPIPVAPLLRPSFVSGPPLFEIISRLHVHTNKAEILYRPDPVSPSAAAVASFSLGLLCSTQDRLQEAINAYYDAIAIQPDFVDAYINLGTVILSLGQREEAATLYRHAIAISPGNALAYGNLGKVLQDLGRIDEAIDAYCEAIARDPSNALVYANFGAALLVQQAWDDSVTVTRHAISLMPGNAIAHANLGAALLRLGRHQEALMACDRAIALQPRGAAIYESLGGVMVELGALEEGESLCRHAISLDPSRPNAHFNLSHALMAMNQLEEAELSARRAIVLRPGSAEYHYGIAHILLLQGNMEAGWMEYDWRWRLPDFALPSRILGELSQPLWAGEDISGKTILIVTEQGLGDIIQFARYLPLVVRKAGRVIVAVAPPVRRLLESIEGITIVSIPETLLSDFDVYCPLLSLPRVFATRLNSIPTGAPYLAPPAATLARWRERLPRSDRLRAGLVWAGNPRHVNDRRRSLAFHALTPLWGVRGLCWASLQIGPRVTDLLAAPPNLIEDLAPELHDFAETAAAVCQLDVVVTVDTAVAHLAGVLGIATFLLLPFASDWRWMRSGMSSPWYPSLRLFRQDAGRSWAPVIEAVATALTTMEAAAVNREG